MDDSRYIVGIDLGTTNIAVFYVDTEVPGWKLEPFPVPQLVGAGEVAARPLLPSFTYLPAGPELPAGALALPWAPAPELAVGEFARMQGAKVPARLITSAKSWLAHGGVDRRQPILPWGSALGAQARSPVAVTALYLAHLRDAWDHVMGRRRDRHGSPCVLAEQQVIVTVPASFDETARDLTIEAARAVGLQHLMLLEEPLAAFYAWLARHEADWQQRLLPGQKVLVVDVGGGTSDFSVVEVDAKGQLHRFAVGDHLLLGGDNIDLAVAREIESGWQTKLGPGEWAMLCQQARAAKERLLGDDAPASVPITLLGAGSSVLRGTRKATLTRATLARLLTEGFYPPVPADAPPPRKAAGMRAMGLPYAAEPAVTRYLLHFLRYAAAVAAGRDATPGAEPGAGGADELLYPDFVLFNGGSLKPELVRRCLLDALAAWFPGRPPPVEMTGAEYDLAVAAGAAYCGKVRRGQGVRVRGGVAQAYFLAASSGASGTPRLVCVLPRETEEQVELTVPGEFRAATNDKVVFTLYSSATRLHDQLGDVVAVDDRFTLVAPLVSVLQYGKGERQAIAVGLRARLTEVGTLELTVAAQESGHRWPLRFDLRPAVDDADSASPAAPRRVVDADRLAAARALLTTTFTTATEPAAAPLGGLEDALGLGRESWSLPVLRELADTLLALEAERRRSPRHEARWLQLAGYCLRPGFGDAADELRLRAVWKLWFAGPAHPKQPQVLAEWWVFWRRLAPGLKAGHQLTVATVLFKALCPRGAYRASIREGEQARVEMWRCLGALERVPVEFKAQAATVLLGRLPNLDAPEWWVLARLGARHPFHAPVNAVVPGPVAADWVTRILAAPPRVHEPLRFFTLARLATRTGDRHLDLPDPLIAQVATALADAPPAWRAHLTAPAPDTREETTKLLGDSLPLGLELVGDVAE